MFDMVVGAHSHTCSYEACCDRGMDGVTGHDALPVCMVGMQRGHVAVKPDQQRTHSYTPSVSQTPTGLVTTVHKKHMLGVNGVVQKGFILIC